MTHLWIAVAFAAGAIVGLVVAGVAPSYNLLLGVASGVAVAAAILVVRRSAEREEDSEPEVRPSSVRRRA